MQWLRNIFGWLNTIAEEVKEQPVIVIAMVFFLILGHWLHGRQMVNKRMKQKAAEYQQGVWEKGKCKEQYQNTVQHFVWHTSPKLQALRILNDTVIKEQLKHGAEPGGLASPEKLFTVINSKYYFEHFDFKVGVIHAVKKAQKDEAQLKYTKSAIKREEKYLAKLEQLPPYLSREEWDMMEKMDGFSFEQYRRAEQTFYEKYSTVGVGNWEIEFVVKHPGKNGEPARWKQKKYRKEEFLKIWKAVEKGIQSNEYQRLLVTPKIRYEVLKRDQFTCRICGRTSSQTKLHVDHIRPISKGGSLGGRNLENLRTLCDLCNIGKADSYDANGIN